MNMVLMRACAACWQKRAARCSVRQDARDKRIWRVQQPDPRRAAGLRVDSLEEKGLKRRTQFDLLRVQTFCEAGTFAHSSWAARALCIYMPWWFPPGRWRRPYSSWCPDGRSFVTTGPVLKDCSTAAFFLFLLLFFFGLFVFSRALLFCSICFDIYSGLTVR